MANIKEEKNSVRLVTRELIKGKSLTTKDICKMLSEDKGEDINTRYVNNILARISNKEKCDLGYFINRVKEGNVYVYNVVEEALALLEEKAYGLTLKTGKERYTLDEALNEFPELSKYTENVTSPAKKKNMNTISKQIEQTNATVENVVTEIKEIIKTYIPEKSVYDSKFKITSSKKSGKVPSYDGTNIYFEIIGEGDLTLVACNGIGVSTFFWKYIVKYFSPNCRIVLWDYRSHGKSDAAKDLDDLTITNCALDLKAVLDYNNIDKAVLLGHSMGCQAIYEFYRLFPERVSGLIPILGSYGNPLSTFLNTDKMIHVVNMLHPLAFKYPEIINPIFNKLIYNPLSYVLVKVTRLVNWQHCKYQELRPYLEHLGSMDQRALMGMAQKMQEHNAKDVLPQIKVPTLIIAGEDDLFTPIRISEEMYRLIPNVEMMMIPRGSHAAIIEQPDLINLRIEKFFRSHDLLS